MARIARKPPALRIEPAERLLTVNDVADYLHISPQTVYALAYKKEVPSLKIGSTRRFRRQDIDEYIGLCTHRKEGNEDGSKPVG